MAADAGSMLQYWSCDVRRLQKELQSGVSEVSHRHEEQECSHRRLVELDCKVKSNVPKVAALSQRCKDESSFLGIPTQLEVPGGMEEEPPAASQLESGSETDARVCGQREGELGEESVLEERLAKAEENVGYLQSALTVTRRELLDLRCKHHEDMSSKATEIGIIVMDLEKANQRAGAAQAEVVRLKKQLAGVWQQENTIMEQDQDRSVHTGSALVAPLLTKDVEIKQLKEELQGLRVSLQEARESCANQITELKHLLTNKVEAIKMLEAKLRSQEDYDQIKSELRLLKGKSVSSHASCSQCDPKATRTHRQASFSPSHQNLVQTCGSPVCCDGAEEGRSAQISRICYSPEEPSGGSSPGSPPILCPHSGKKHPENKGLINQELLSAHCKNGGSTHFDLVANVSPTPTSQRPNCGAETGLHNPSESISIAPDDKELLETAGIANQVKEQLLKHNIGQRVFGHYVLGLSQGSVSEILARPKPWGKLTVKGKEPFVKMKQFLSDEQNILALRTIQIRQRGSITPRIRTPETGSDDAIKNILELAKKEIQSQRGGDGNSPAGSASSSSNSANSSSDEAIKNILEQARQEMQVQEHQQALREMEACRWSPSLAQQQDAQIKQEECPTILQAPLSRLSPAAFVQNIIRKVKSEIGEAEMYFEQHWAADPAGQRVLASVSPSLSSSSSLGQRGEDGGTEDGEESGGEVKASYSSTYMRRALKPTVPPLTPEQYETYMYREVDTAELTRLVKDKLAKNGICQRIFGEKVLGLSQGSVSDMLSRPKPWTKLTQKGREPFIRMQLWLMGQLGQAVKHGLSQTPSDDASPNPAVSTASPEEEDLASKQLSVGIQHLVALSPELDTQQITRRVKEVLTDNNLGQKLFGESILGLTQGSVSDLLSRPKPWHSLSLKGREPFVRMQMWLNDALNVAKLKDSKKLEKNVYQKRRYCPGAPTSDSDSASVVSDTSSPGVGSTGHGGAKRARVVLSSQDKETLLKAYTLEPYPSQQTVELLANQLSLKASTINNWFHNYRSRMRREVLQDSDAEMKTLDSSHSRSPATEQYCGEILITVKQEAAESSVLQEDCEKHGRTLLLKREGTASEGECCTEELNTSPEAGLPPAQANNKANQSEQRHNEKVANLNSIIHRLERAANREETLQWEF